MDNKDGHLGLGRGGSLLAGSERAVRLDPPPPNGVECPWLRNSSVPAPEADTGSTGGPGERLTRSPGAWRGTPPAASASCPATAPRSGTGRPPLCGRSPLMPQTVSPSVTQRKRFYEKTRICTTKSKKEYGPDFFFALDLF